jgi:hypothetical protein
MKNYRLLTSNIMDACDYSTLCSTADKSQICWQAERLEDLQQRLSVPFDGSRAEHQVCIHAAF